MKKLLIFLVFLTTLSIGARAETNRLNSQLVTISFEKTTLNNVIWEMEKQTDFKFVYATSDIEDVTLTNIEFISKPVTTVLDKCLEGTELNYSYSDGVIAIKKSSSNAIPQEELHLVGSITDELGEPIAGANIIFLDTRTGNISDANGRFNIKVKENKHYKAEISFMGFVTQIVYLDPARQNNIVLKEDINLLEEVIVTGYGDRKSVV